MLGSEVYSGGHCKDWANAENWAELTLGGLICREQAGTHTHTNHPTEELSPRIGKASPCIRAPFESGKFAQDFDPIATEMRIVVVDSTCWQKDPFSP